MLTLCQSFAFLTLSSSLSALIWLADASRSVSARLLYYLVPSLPNVSLHYSWALSAAFLALVVGSLFHFKSLCMYISRSRSLSIIFCAHLCHLHRCRLSLFMLLSIQIHRPSMIIFAYLISMLRQLRFSPLRCRDIFVLAFPSAISNGCLPSLCVMFMCLYTTCN